MTELARLLLLLVLAGAAFTAVISGAVWWFNEERRIQRALVRVLGAPLEAQLIAHGRGRGVGFSMAAGGIAVAWDAGAWCLVYRLAELVGVELIVDGHVAARVFRDEPRRPLDRMARDADTVTLRLVFDDPRNPDFVLDLWPPRAEHRNAPQSPAAVLAETNRWLARVEAVLRRTAPAPAQAAPVVQTATARHAPPAPPEPPPWDDDDLEIDDFEDLDDPEEH
jgi:hypothetical protein